MAAPPKKAFPLRLDPVLFASIERVAAADFRSANAQIEVLLREALTRRGVKVGTSEAPRRGRPAKKGGA
ncbi:MAG: toxin-antitoxin system HicB family antitoxin [Sphingorhabdus sp.]